MYKEIKKINEMLWMADDCIDQDTLFALQDYVANLLLKVANMENKADDLVKSFPWLYATNKIELK